MDCTTYRAAVHDYALGRLSAERVAQVVEHRRSCPHCAEFNAICAELECRDFVRFLDDYVAGNLDRERRRIFERHMSICTDCVNYLRSYRRTMELSAASGGPSAEPAERIPEELITAILAASKEPPPERGW